MYKRMTNDEFISRANKTHGGKYDYSKTLYINQRTKIKIKCSIHGEQEILPENHLGGLGCPRCSKEVRRSDIDSFIKKANKIHGEKYDYSKALYINARTKIEIKCYMHGLFYQTPSEHLCGKGCPKCNESKGENKIKAFLINKKIDFVQEKKFEECKNKISLRFDFYLPKYNLCIEFDGRQHFQPETFGGNSKEDAIKKFEEQKIKDDIKTKFCKDNNIKLLRIPYWKFKNIENILIKELPL